MHLWDYPKNTKMKEDEEWYLERVLTYGLDGEKLNIDMVKRNWEKIKARIPNNTRAFFELLIWGKPF